MSDFPQNIAYFARAESRLFHLKVVKALVEKYKCNIHLFCNGKEQVDFYNACEEAPLFSSIQDGGFLLYSALLPVENEQEVYQKAASIEKQIGRPYARISSANRHLGRGFSPGGFYHPRSHTSSTSTQLSITNAYNKVFEFFFQNFKEKKIELAINPYKEACVVANTLDIPYRMMAGSRFHNYHYWAWNEHYETPCFFDNYSRRKENHIDPVLELKKPYNAHLDNRRAFFASRSILSAMRTSLRTIAQHCYWRLKGYDKGSKGYFMRDMALLPIRRYFAYRRLRKISTTTLEDMAGIKFVFFPLHIEPEAALQIISPEYLVQMAAVTSLARELPAGVKLVVKEAFGMIGRRPVNFYDQICEHKNVVFMRTDQLGLDCVRQSIAVATISGSAGLEALVNGKPVIAFGRHNIYNCIDSVFVIKDEVELYPVIEKICYGELDESKIRLEGQRFLEAIVDESFDMDKFDYKNMNSFTEKNVTDCIDKLVASVQSSLERPRPY